MASANVNPVEASLRLISNELGRTGQRWALIGGLAVSARAEPRTTRDVDVAVGVVNIEREVSARAEVIEILPGVPMPVARIGHLMALKILARDDRRRPQDVDDLRALLREADEPDLVEARDALATIESRGFHRGRSLVRALEEFIKEERG